MTVEFWFEFASTYSYPAAMRIEELAARRGVAITWRPFLLGPIFSKQGWSDSPFNIYPVKGRYMWRDLERICEAHGLPLQRPSVFPRFALLAARIACQFQDAAWLPDFVKAVYRANFATNEDIAAPSIVERCLAVTGATSSSILAEAQSSAAKDKLRAQTEHAVQLGIFGAPTFMVDGEMFWGNDRLETALEWARRNDSDEKLDDSDAEALEGRKGTVSESSVR